MLFLSSLSLLLAATPAFGQSLNPWRQRVFLGCCGSEEIVDGNPNTVSRIRGGLPAQQSLLFNFKETYIGFYILSSGNYITDYDIVAIDVEWRERVVGRVTGATSNFTAVNFYDADGYPEIFSDIIYLRVYGINGNYTANSTATVNEIWPIYRDEEIVYPPGQTASPSPTQPGATSISTRTTPTPTATGLKLNRWPDRPGVWAGGSQNAEVVTDQNLDTVSENGLLQGDAGAWLFLSHGYFNNLAGIYVVSGGVNKEDNFLEAYHVVMRNVDTFEWHEVCRVTGASSNFTVCPFVDESGNKGYTSWVMELYPDRLSGFGARVRIHEVYPIWASDYIVDPEKVPGGVYGEKNTQARLL